MKTILVTGAAGFIGSNLCAKLLERGERVIALDNFLTGSRNNIRNFAGNENFIFIEHDIVHPFEFDGAIDEIYNLACPASPDYYQKDPIYTTRINVLGALNMLQIATAQKAKILQASTSEVYGDPEVHPQDENYRGNVNPIGPRACYDEGKRCVESLFFDHHRSRGTDIKIIRIFNTYGPNMSPNDGRVVSNFIVAALKNENICVYGDGSQSRSFQYIDDLIDGMMKMMAVDDFTGPVNLGNPNEFTINELAEKIIKLIPQSKSKIIYKALPVDDPRRRRPDISLAMEKLSWKPIVSLDDGLIKTVNYFKNIINN